MQEISIAIPEYIKDIIATLNSSGYEAYVVGGCVRDSLLNIPANDWDVCSSAKPHEVKVCLSDFKVIETGVKHGTVTAVFDKNTCEITTFRADGSYTDHRRPDSVEFTANIEDDLKRRDFTINAMAYSPACGLIDLFDGCKDLDANIIRCVGHAKKRFNEDALRIMRALRFSAKLGFRIEEETSSAIEECSELLKCIAKERINHELSGILLGSNQEFVLLNYKKVFQTILGDMETFSQWSEITQAISRSEAILPLRLSLLFDKESDSDAENLLRKLKFDKRTISQCLFLLRNRDFVPYYDEIFFKKSLSQFGLENLKLLMFRYFAKNSEINSSENVYALLDSILKKAPPLKITDLKINGDDLIKLGIPEGKKIREMLTFLLDAVLSNRVENTKEELIGFLVTNQYKDFFEKI